MEVTKIHIASLNIMKRLKYPGRTYEYTADQYLREFEVIMVQEADSTRRSRKQVAIWLAQYNLYWSRGSGLMTAVHKKFESKLGATSHTGGWLMVVDVVVDAEKPPIHLVNVYYKRKSLFVPLLKIAKQFKTNVLIAGDFNARIGIHCNWSDGNRATQDSVVNQDGRRWRYVLRVASWFLLNGNVDGDREGRVTHLGHSNRAGTVIDYAAVSSDCRGNVERMVVRGMAGSDHNALEITWKVNPVEVETKTIRQLLDDWAPGTLTVSIPLTKDVSKIHFASTPAQYHQPPPPLPPSCGLGFEFRSGSCEGM